MSRGLSDIKIRIRAQLGAVLAANYITESISAEMHAIEAELDKIMVSELPSSVRNAAIRFELLAGRFRGCEAHRPDDERHALSIDECMAFAEETRADVKKLAKQLGVKA